MLGRGQFAEAERILVRLSAPDRPEVRTLLEMLDQARAASDEKHFYKRSREKARTLIQQRGFDQAADLLRKLLSLFPRDPELERDLESAQAGRVPVAQAAAAGATSGAQPQRAEPQMFEIATRPAWSVPATPKVAAILGIVLVAGASAAVWKFSQPRVSVSIPVAQASDTREVPRPVAPPELHPSPAVIPPHQERLAPPQVIKVNAPALERVPEVQQTTRRAFSVAARPASATDLAQAVGLPAPPSTVLTPAPGVLSGVQALVEDVAPASEGLPKSAMPPDAQHAPGGGNFQEPKLVSAPAPVFPALARQQHIFGVVNLEATVDKAGAVTKVTALHGNPNLVTAAKDAVMKWRYQPATLNGQPFETKIAITVNFQANQK